MKADNEVKNKVSMRDATPRRVLYATAPLLLWAAHFALMYLLAVLQAGRATMLAFSALALAGAAGLLWHAARSGPARPLHEVAFAASAVLAAIAIVWTCAPVLLLT